MRAPLTLAMGAIGAIGAILGLSCSPTSNDKDCCSTLKSGAYQHVEYLVDASANAAAPETTTLIGRNILKADGSYQLIASEILTRLGWDQQPIYEQKGRWKHTGDSLILTEVEERSWDQTQSAMGAWSMAGVGRIASQIRNVRAGSYEEYAGDLNSWVTWIATP